MSDEEIITLHSTIIGSIYARTGQTPNDQERNGNDAMEVASAVLAKDLDLLRTYAVHAKSTMNTLREVKMAYKLLAGQMVRSPGSHLTPDKVQSRSKITVTLIEIRRLYGAKADTDGIQRILLTADDADVPRIEEILIERVPATGEQLQELLDDMKRSPSSIASGVL